MKSLISSEYQITSTILKKFLEITFFLALISSSLQILYADENQETDESRKSTTIQNEAVAKQTEEPQTITQKENANLVDENSEASSSTSEVNKEEIHKKKDHLEINLVKTPKDKNKQEQKPKYNITFDKNFKNTKPSEQAQKTYKRTIVKSVKGDLSEKELAELAEKACSDYRPQSRKNYLINFVNESNGKTVGNYNCEGF